MKAVGIDLGGTKSEAQIFASDWSVQDRHRVDTPKTYDALVAVMADQIAWAKSIAGDVPIGISAAGLVNPTTGLALTANLPATGRPLPADIEAASGCKITYVNDCRALTLSEATLGVAKGRSPVVGLIIGTGIGGGAAVDGRLIEGPAMVGGEFGHTHAPAHLIVKHGLPVVQCGCGRVGCVETYIAGPGLSRIAKHITGKALTPPEIAATRHTDPDAARVWDIWTEIVAELLMTLTLTIDPEVIVLGGGLSNAAGVAQDLSDALVRSQLNGYPIPEILTAQGGDTSGARGAALAALQEAANG